MTALRHVDRAELAARDAFPRLFAMADDLLEKHFPPPPERNTAMSTHDLLEDGFPHGTKEGFERGCKGGWCPAGADHGLSCRRAQILSAGDYRYQRMFRAGATPGEIADALGLHPEIRSAPSTGRSPAPTPAPPRPTAPKVGREAEKPAPKQKWRVQHAWVAFAPDGTMYGPFDGHPAAMGFVGERLSPTAEQAEAPAQKKRRPMTEEDQAELRRLHAEGHSDGEIGRRMGRAQPVISAWRRRMGLESAAIR